jgi:pimeloyl-ACP methyl ester carboxylesterase
MGVLQGNAAASAVAPLWGELRYSGEFARLLVDRNLLERRERSDAPPVLLIPGFMAGDASLGVLRHWLRRRGHRVSMSGMFLNVNCAERIVSRLQDQLVELSEETGRPVVLIGQSRGGAIARALAVREPERVCGLVMLGSPVADSLAVAPPVMRTVRWLAMLGDLGVPGLFSGRCHEGECCERFRGDLSAPLMDTIDAVAVYSRSDGIVDWRACIDPHAESIEVDSSHCGMSVHPAVYKAFQRVLA